MKLHGRSRRAWVLAGLLVIATVARLAVAWVAMHGIYDPYARLHGDMAKYIAAGLSLSRGEGLSLGYRNALPEMLQGAPAPTENPPPTSAISPGYPLFLALFFKLAGYRLYALIIVQALMSAATVALVYLLARDLDAHPLWALAFAALYYPFALDAAYVLTETLLTFLTTLSLWLWLRPDRSRWSGVVAGATLLVKSVAAPFFLLALLIDRRRWAWCLAGLALVLLPWALRNARHTGVPYITASYGGSQLMQLHNAANREFPLFNAPGDLTEGYPGYDAILEAAGSRAPKVSDPVAQEYLRDAEMAREATRFIRSDPRQFLRAVWRSFANMWRIDYPSANRIRLISNLILYAGLMPFAFAGVVKAVRTRNRPLLLLALFLACFVGAHAVVASEIRYRISAMPAYFVVAAFGLPRARRAC